MRRREFITLLGGGAVVASPLTARALQTDKMRRIGSADMLALVAGPTWSRMTRLGIYHGAQHGSQSAIWYGVTVTSEGS
jgi:hypothetical protein